MLARAIHTAPQIGDLLPVLNGLMAQFFICLRDPAHQLILFIFQPQAVLFCAVKLLCQAYFLVLQCRNSAFIRSYILFEPVSEALLRRLAEPQRILCRCPLACLCLHDKQAGRQRNITAAGVIFSTFHERGKQLFTRSRARRIWETLARAAKALALPVKRFACLKRLVRDRRKASAYLVRQQKRPVIRQSAFRKRGKIKRRVDRLLQLGERHAFRQVRQLDRERTDADAQVGRNVARRDVERRDLPFLERLREQDERHMACRIFLQRCKLTQLLHGLDARNRWSERRDLAQTKARIVREQADKRRTIDLAQLFCVLGIGDHRAEAAVQLSV